MGNARRTIPARLDRVQTHLDALDERIQSFVCDEDTYRVEPEHSDDRTEVVFYVTALQAAPLQWGPLISDIVNGLRASLDNLVWALSAKEQARLGIRPPRGRLNKGNPWKQIAFPVVLDGADWNRVAADKLRFVSSNMQRALREVQPFATGKNAPHREPLALTHELWNIDKHRHVSLVSVWVGGEETEITVVPKHPIPGVEFRTTRVTGARVLELNKKIELARATPVSVAGSVAGLSMAPFPPMGVHLNLDHSIPFQITFKSGFPGYRRDVLDVLRAVHDMTRSLVESLHRELR